MDEVLFHRLAQQVADEWQVGGFTGTIYEDFAEEILRRYLAIEVGIFEPDNKDESDN